MESQDIGSHCNGSSPGARVGRVLVACALLSLIAGCGTRFFYNRLDWLSHYYVTSQVSLDDAQSCALQSSLDDFLAWHRRTELPRYARFLDRMANDAARPVSLEKFEAGQREIDGFMDASVARVAPAAARWLDGLRPAQVDELFASFAEKERKARAERCDSAPEERQARRTRKFIDNVEQWTGRLDRAQRTLIATRYAAVDTDECAKPASGARLELRALVDRYRTRPEFAARLGDYLAHPEKRGDAAYRRDYEADRERFLRLLADINHSLTAAQRTRTIERLRGYAEDMRGLAAQSDAT